MALTRDEVEHIAHLARLQLSEDEKERFRKQLSSILEHVAKLQDLDTEHIQPMSSVVVARSRLRVDEVGECLTPEQLLSNAPDVESKQFRVPLVLDQDPS
ncbi:MAG: Asp-tRNA(Asn)/Glu-tRNA(Gln) amidotransferase subunit GatC [Chloroflexi bacterium]|nr:Asp-tRNA(Asn)/Glu-tRNA(Gln) amidotransferase subunit GatC [Chloroflexota bacterium]